MKLGFNLENLEMRTLSLSIYLFLLISCSTSPRLSLQTIRWLQDSISKELKIALPLDALTIIQRLQFDSIHPGIIATVKVDQLNGGIFIYQWINNQYKLQYRKAEPIYNVQYNNDHYLMFESGFTGTGQKNTNFYLVEINPFYCTDIWSAPASSYNFTSVAPYYSLDGSIQLNSLDEGFIYTQIHRTFLKTEFDFNKPDSILSRSEIYSIKNLPAYKQLK